MAREREGGEVKPGILRVVTGPTRAGKDMVMKQLLIDDPRLKQLVTYTTRPMRPREIDGVDYHFITREEFVRMEEAGEFLETNPYYDFYYGTTKDSLMEVVAEGKDVIWRVDLSLAARLEDLIRDKFDLEMAMMLLDRLVVVAIIPDEVATLRRRWEGEGGENVGRFWGRMRQDAKVWRENRHKFAHVIVNPDGAQEQTVEKVGEIIGQRRLELKIRQANVGAGEIAVEWVSNLRRTVELKKRLEGIDTTRVVRADIVSLICGDAVHGLIRARDLTNENWESEEQRLKILRGVAASWLKLVGAVEEFGDMLPNEWTGAFRAVLQKYEVSIQAVVSGEPLEPLEVAGMSKQLFGEIWDLYEDPPGMSREDFFYSESLNKQIWAMVDEESVAED